MFEYYKCDLFTFIDIFTKAVGPTARKALEYKEKNPKNWERLIEKMEAIADPTSEADKDSKKAQEVSLSLDQFMECMKHWKAEIGIPRDLHAACADFVPGSANIMRVSEGALGEAFDRALIEAGGMPLQLTPELRMYDLPEEPRGELLPHAILFAGEGCHYVGMLKGCKDYPAIKDKIRKANKILGYDILDLCLNGPEEKLEKLEFNGPAMYVAGWAAYELFLMDNRAVARRALAVAGMGVGEYVALAVAGVFTFEVGLKLVIGRAKAMQELSEIVTDQAVVSVAGLQEDRTRQLCSIALSKVKGDKEVCQIATVLFNRGYTVGGTKKAVQMFKKLADEDGAMQSKVIKTPVASCTPMMSAAQWPMKVKLREFQSTFEAPWCHVFFGAQGDLYLKADKKEEQRECISTTCDHLCKALYSECQWEKVITTMMEEKNISSFYECSPNKQCKAMMKRISKAAFDNTHNYIV
jgi:[acyl-carrier-protein] S-malonyltransferase